MYVICMYVCVCMYNRKGKVYVGKGLVLGLRFMFHFLLVVGGATFCFRRKC